MWCPKCKAEYRDGITVCAECGADLVKTLPVEVDASPAENKVKTLNRIDGRENLQALSDGNKAYVEKQTKYEDMKSTAYSFILVGAAGLILMILIFTNIITLQFAAHMKSIMGIVMTGLFLIFLAIGIHSYMQLDALKAQVQKEAVETDAAKDWFFEYFSAASVDAALQIREENPLQQKYFMRSSHMKQKLQEQFPDYEASFLDHLTEQFYEELFEQD